MKVHLTHVGYWGGRPVARCGGGGIEVALTADPSKVTCQTCEKRLNDDLEPLDERIEREARQKARNRARSAAVTELVERHNDEFQQLWEQFTEPLVAGYRVEVEADIRSMERREADRIAKRRAELERELESLR